MSTGGVGSIRSGWALRHSLLQGGFAAASIAILAPVVLRGDWVQRTLATLLLLLPVLSLLGAFLIAAGMF